MGIANIVTDILDLYSRFAKLSPSELSTIETAEDGQSIAHRDGSLATIVRIDGSRSMLGKHELPDLVQSIEQEIGNFFRAEGHAIQFWIGVDPGRSGDVMRDEFSMLRENLSNQGIDLIDLIDERETLLPRIMSWEQTYMVLWTRPSSVDANDIKRQMEENGRSLENFPRHSGQNIIASYPSVVSEHRTFVDHILSAFRSERIGIVCEVEEVHDALREIRNIIYPELADREWRPVLPGDRIPVRQPRNISPDKNKSGGVPDITPIMWPDLNWQLFAMDCSVPRPTVSTFGGTSVVSLDMQLAPDRVQGFDTLFRSIRATRRDMPFRASFLLESGDIGAGMQLKKMFASILMLTNKETNTKVRRSIESINEARINENATLTRLRVNFATWGPASDPNIAYERGLSLMRSVNSWGGASAIIHAGDPVEGALSSVPGIACASTAPAAVAPLAEIIPMLPVTRPSSPWKEGSLVFRTPDGKPFPYMPGSSLQTTWVDLVFSPPGGGKSVLLSTISLATVMRSLQTQGRVPYIRIADVGFSSSGLISLVREALPPARQHEVTHFRLTMTPEHSVNPFDTELGGRYPLPKHRDFLVNLLIQICTPAGHESPYDGMVDLINYVVDEVYRIYADERSPKMYQPDIDREVDDAVRKLGIKVYEGSTWWSMVDQLFENGYHHEASLAQRHAVPVLVDTIGVANERRAQDIYAAAGVQTGESVIAAYSRMITTATSDYRILLEPTRFDIGTAKICALDLAEVTGVDAKRTAIVYMLARHILCSGLFGHLDDVQEFPELYRSYHEARITSLSETSKTVIFDEFHRTQNAVGTRRQVVRDIREARKIGIQLILSSQLLDDFSDEIVQNATGVWIMKTPQGEADRIAERFGVRGTAQETIRRHLNGPTSSGAPFLAIFALKDGMYCQHLVSSLGPVELWSFSTTECDVELRRRLYDEIGPAQARALLSRRFRNGTASTEYEKRRREAMRSSMGAVAGDHSIIADMAAEILQEYRASLAGR